MYIFPKMLDLTEQVWPTKAHKKVAEAVLLCNSQYHTLSASERRGRDYCGDPQRQNQESNRRGTLFSWHQATIGGVMPVWIIIHDLDYGEDLIQAVLDHQPSPEELEFFQPERKSCTRLKIQKWELNSLSGEEGTIYG